MQLFTQDSQSFNKLPALLEIVNIDNANKCIYQKLIQDTHRFDRNQKLRLKQQYEDWKLLQKICEQHFNESKDTQNSDLVEIYRLRSLVEKYKVSNLQIIQKVISNFSIHKNQEKLVMSDTNENNIISLAANKYEILSFRAMDQKQQKFSSRSPKSKSIAQLKKMNFSFK